MLPGDEPRLTANALHLTIRDFVFDFVIRINKLWIFFEEKNGVWVFKHNKKAKVIERSEFIKIFRSSMSKLFSQFDIENESNRCYSNGKTWAGCLFVVLSFFVQCHGFFVRFVV